MQKQNGFIQTLLLALVLFIIAGVGSYYYFTNKKITSVPTNTSIVAEYQTDYKEAAKNAPTVISASDLKNVSASLDSTDLNQIDSELNLLSADSSTF